MYFYVVSVVVLALDQLLKHLVHKFMHFGQSIPLLNGIVKLTYVRNTGAAFSLFVGFSPYLVVVGVLVVLAVLYFHRKIPRNDYVLQFGLAFVLGGSLGNLLDRVFRSYVIDYFDITIWPVFNFADVMINIGVIMIAFRLFAGEKDNVSSSL